MLAPYSSSPSTSPSTNPKCEIILTQPSSSLPNTSSLLTSPSLNPKSSTPFYPSFWTLLHKKSRQLLYFSKEIRDYLNRHDSESVLSNITLSDIIPKENGEAETKINNLFNSSIFIHTQFNCKIKKLENMRLSDQALNSKQDVFINLQVHLLVLSNELSLAIFISENDSSSSSPSSPSSQVSLSEVNNLSNFLSNLGSDFDSETSSKSHQEKSRIFVIYMNNDSNPSLTWPRHMIQQITNIPGKSLADLIDEEDQRRLPEYLQNIRRNDPFSRRSLQVTQKIKSKNNQIIPVALHLVSFKNIAFGILERWTHLSTISAGNIEPNPNIGYTKFKSSIKLPDTNPYSSKDDHKKRRLDASNEVSSKKPPSTDHTSQHQNSPRLEFPDEKRRILSCSPVGFTDSPKNIILTASPQQRPSSPTSSPSINSGSSFSYNPAQQSKTDYPAFGYPSRFTAPRHSLDLSNIKEPFPDVSTDRKFSLPSLRTLIPDSSRPHKGSLPDFRQFSNDDRPPPFAPPRIQIQSSSLAAKAHPLEIDTCNIRRSFDGQFPTPSPSSASIAFSPLSTRLSPFVFGERRGSNSSLRSINTPISPLSPAPPPIGEEVDRSSKKPIPPSAIQHYQHIFDGVDSAQNLRRSSDSVLVPPSSPPKNRRFSYPLRAPQNPMGYPPHPNHPSHPPNFHPDYTLRSGAHMLDERKRSMDPNMIREIKLPVFDASNAHGRQMYQPAISPNYPPPYVYHPHMTASLTEPYSGSPRKQCEKCHTESSPEWRRGPGGHKTLCNACGLRYSRHKNKCNKSAQRKSSLKIEHSVSNESNKATPDPPQQPPQSISTDRSNNVTNVSSLLNPEPEDSSS